MATNEKVDVVIVGAGASGSVYAAVLARQGKSVVVLEQGPDWQLSDLISSDIWGRRVKPAGGPFILEGKHPVSYGYQAGWGVGGAALHYFANFPRLLPNDFKMKSEHNARMTGRSRMRMSRRTMTRSPAMSASQAMPKQRRSGGRRVSPIQCRR